MKFSLLLKAIIILLFSNACNKNDREIDPNYPTIVTEISTARSNEILNQFAESSLSSCMAIDTFGFPFFDVKNDTVCINEDWRINNTKEEIEARIKTALYDYAEFLNLNNSEPINILSINTIDGKRFDKFKELYPDSFPNTWLVTTQLQNYNGIPVRGTYLQILLSPEDVIGIRGHWYNFIYIPEVEKYPEEEAKKLLYDRSFKYSNSEIITTENTTWHTSNKIILPIHHSDDQIELHVCWALYPSSWEIIVDCETGDIIQSINIDKI